jgi:hypothetical protein
MPSPPDDHDADTPQADEANPSKEPGGTRKREEAAV